MYDYLSTAPNLKADGRATATTLDAFVAERGLRPTFIKADVEGGEMQCVEGMAATVQKFRPVLSICIYHTPEQFFDLKPRLEEMTRDLSRLVVRSLALGMTTEDFLDAFDAALASVAPEPTEEPEAQP